MHVSELKQSRYLTKEDVGDGQLVVIDKVTQEDVAMEGEKPDVKWCLWFKHVEKPMVLNSTNGQLIAKITGSEDSDGWIGKQIELYNDPSIMFAGKVVGGIRVRAHRSQARPAPAPAPAPPRPAQAPPRVQQDEI